jgi:hypothetical protein
VKKWRAMYTLRLAAIFFRAVTARRELKRETRRRSGKIKGGNKGMGE